MKSILPLFLALCLLVSSLPLLRCDTPSEPDGGLEKFSEYAFDCFDTVTTVTGYASTQEEFDRVADAALAELQENIRRKKKAQNLLAHFSEEATRLNAVMEDRKKEYEQEQAESDDLQSATLTLLFYSLLGVKEEKLSKEESEALAAKAAYETAKAELDHVLNRQVELRAEIRRLGNCERYYEDMLAEKKAWLMAKEATVSAEVEALETEKAAIIRDSKELKEAMESGQYVLRVARSVMKALSTADRLNKKDTYGGYNRSHTGVLVSSIHDIEVNHEKRNTLVRLENSMQTLGKYLRDFAAELKDVSALPMEHLPDTHFSSKLMFFDRWADGLFAELVVAVKLDRIYEKMTPLMDALVPLVKDLETEYSAREEACREIDEKIRTMVIEK